MDYLQLTLIILDQYHYLVQSIQFDYLQNLIDLIDQHLVIIY
jgi:hypothetical protein